MIDLHIYLNCGLHLIRKEKHKIVTFLLLQNPDILLNNIKITKHVV